MLFIVFAVSPVIIAIVAVELHLRAETAQWYQKKLSKNHALRNSLLIHRKSDDPILAYELTPGSSADKQGIHYQINQAGFRDDEFPPQTDRSNDEYRIVVLGDSVAWGWGVDMSQVWPQRLEKELQDQVGASRQVRVYNLAVNGYSTPQELRVLSKYGLAYQPNLVILNYVLNDPEVEDGGLSWYFDAVNRIEILYKGKFLFSFLFNVLKNKLGLSAEPPNNSAMDHFYLIHNSDLFKNVEQGFEDLDEITKKSKIPVMVMVTPVFEFKKNQPYPWAEIHKQIENLADQHRFVYLDIQPAFKSLDGSDVSFDPIHPNVQGHAMIAYTVNNKILSSNLIH